MIRSFVAFNRRASAWLGERFRLRYQPQNCDESLAREVTRMVEEDRARAVLEVGGIDRPMLDRSRVARYDGLDIEHHEQCDRLYHRFFVQSIEAPLPVSETYDLVFSRTVLEHVPNNDAALRTMFAALRPGGTTVHYVPCKYHPYSLCLRLVGSKLQRTLIRAFRPASVDVTGYPAFFHRCSARQLRAAFERAGFRGVEIEAYYKAEDYFAFFVPAYLFVVAFNWTAGLLGLRAVASGVRIRAHRPAPVPGWAERPEMAEFELDRVAAPGPSAGRGPVAHEAAPSADRAPSAPSRG